MRAPVPLNVRLIENPQLNEVVRCSVMRGVCCLSPKHLPIEAFNVLRS